MTERIITDSNGRKHITTEPFKPDYNTEAVLVEEMQRMAKCIEELEQKVAARSAKHLDAHITYDQGYQEGRQDAEKHMRNTNWMRFVEQKHFKMGYDAGVLETQLDQALERNFCHRCGKRLMSALGPVSLHTCTPPQPIDPDASMYGKGTANANKS